MKNLLLMSLFGLCMTVAFSAQSVSGVSLVAPAYAGGSNDDDESNGHDDESNSNAISFSCPEGVTTCYRADGSEYIDVNNMSATAAGIESDGDNEHGDDEHESDDAHVSTNSTATYANPRHYRSF